MGGDWWAVSWWVESSGWGLVGCELVDGEWWTVQHKLVTLVCV